MEQDPTISQARHRQKVIACLPRLFDTTRLFFQSKNHSVVTKDELKHNVVSQNLRIVDKSEVEKQLTLLVELAPEWINVKSSMSGDLIVRINKISNPEVIRTRLLEAKYELLQEFFNCLESSIRLLVLKGSLTNFTNISLQVECLTERRFTQSFVSAEINRS